MKRLSCGAVAATSISSDSVQMRWPFRAVPTSGYVLIFNGKETDDDDDDGDLGGGGGGGDAHCNGEAQHSGQNWIDIRWQKQKVRSVKNDSGED